MAPLIKHLHTLASAILLGKVVLLSMDFTKTLIHKERVIMNTNRNNMAACLFLTVFCALSGGTSQVLAVEGQDKGRTVSAIRLRCTWPMCFRRVLHNKQASSREMKW